MKLFYRALLALTRYELAIARSTGRNPANIAALSADELRWQQAIFLAEVNHDCR